MGDHTTNARAIAKSAGGRQVRVLDLGDDLGLLGFELQPVMVMEGTPEGEAPPEPPYVAAVLVAVGVKRTVLTGPEPIGVVVGEVGRIPLARLKALLAGEEVPS